MKRTMEKIMVMIAVLALLVISSCASVGAPATEEESRAQQVFDFEEKDKGHLYDLSNRWFVESFGDATAVIEYSNKESGTIMGKYTYNTSMVGPLAMSVYDWMEVTIQLELRDERARMTILNPRIRNNPTSASGSINWSTPTRSQLDQADYQQHTQRMFISYEAYINQTQGDW